MLDENKIFKYFYNTRIYVIRKKNSVLGVFFFFYNLKQWIFAFFYVDPPLAADFPKLPKLGYCNLELW